MSVVTNLLLAFSILEEVPERLAEVNSYFETTERPQGFVDAWSDGDDEGPQDPDRQSAWVGGSKYLEHPTFAGAFNHLDLDALIAHIRSMHWYDPTAVQLIVCRQGDDVYSIIQPFPGDRK